MDVSIIIVSYNTRELLRNCLLSVYQYTKKLNFEVIVVDNKSVDGTSKMLDFEFKDVTLIESPINLGFGRANNLGIAKAKGKYVYLLNSDTILLNDAVSFLFEYMETNNSDNSIGAIGAQLIDENLLPVASYGNFPTLRNESIYIFNKIKQFIFNRIESENRTEFEVDYITGADLFIPKNALDLVGVFDPVFFMYYEETDLQKRMEQKNLKRLIVQGPKIIHLEGGSILSASKYSYNKFRLSMPSLHKYIEKHFFGFDFFIFDLFIKIIRLQVLFDKRFSFSEKTKALKLIFGKKYD